MFRPFPAVPSCTCGRARWKWWHVIFSFCRSLKIGSYPSGKKPTSSSRYLGTVWFRYVRVLPIERCRTDNPACFWWLLWRWASFDASQSTQYHAVVLPTVIVTVLAPNFLRVYSIRVRYLSIRPRKKYLVLLLYTWYTSVRSPSLPA